RARGGPGQHPGSGPDGRCGAVAPYILDHRAAHPARHCGGGVVLRCVLCDRQDGRDDPDRRRTGTRDRGGDHVVLRQGHRRWRAQPGYRHRAVPRAGAPRRGSRDPARRPTHGATVVATSRVAGLRRRRIRRRRLGRILVHAMAYAAALVGAGPFGWSLLTAVKLNRDLYNPTHNPLWFHDPPTLDHVSYLWRHTAFPTFAWNTTWTGSLVVAATLLFAVPTGYALARLNRPWTAGLSMAIF